MITDDREREQEVAGRLAASCNVMPPVLRKALLMCGQAMAAGHEEGYAAGYRDGLKAGQENDRAS